MTPSDALLLAAVVAAFVAMVVWLKLPVSLSLACASILLALVAGYGIPVDKLVEGMFGYLDVGLVLVMAMIFMKVIEANGLLGELTRRIIVSLGGSPILLLVALTVIIMFPGMITGSCTASVLGTGALVAPVLMQMGLPLAVAGAVISSAAVYGMIAPPVNILVMIIGGGIDLPYIGFDLILILITFPLAIATTLFLATKWVDKSKLAGVVSRNRMIKPPAGWKGGWISYLPLVVVFVLMIGPKAFPKWFPDPRLPLTFFIGSVVGILSGKKIDVVKSSRDAVSEILPVIGILFGVGMLIEILTLTGLRGAIVVGALSLPKALILVGIAVIMPLFGGISVYGGASVLGVPFALAMLGGNQIIVLSALSLIGAMGSYMPPVALTPVVTAQLIGEKNYFEIVKRCLLPAVFAIAVGVLMLAFPNQIAKLLGV